MKYKKIVLVNLPVWVYNSPPLNIAYLSAYAKQYGYKVKCFDFNIELLNMADSKQKEYWKSDYRSYWSIKSKWEEVIKPNLGQKMINYMLEKILLEKPDVVGFTLVYSSQLINDLAKQIKERFKHTIILVGGHLAGKDFLGKELLLKDVDFCILGEGEVTLIKILEALNKKNDIKRLKGIAFNRNGEIIENPMRERIIDLDDLPFPDFSDYNLFSYKDYDMQTPSIRMPILFSRGCISSCDFCLQTSIWGKPYLCRSPQNLLNEILRDINLFHVTNFQFADLSVNGDLNKLNDLCELLILKRINIGWSANAIIRKEMDLNFFKKMKLAGCQWLDIGLESGSRKVLHAMGKTFLPDDAKLFFKNMNTAGIRASLCLIVGHPEEKIEDFNETIKLLKESSCFIRNLSPGVSLCSIQPKTLLFHKVSQYGGDPTKDSGMEWNLNGLDFNERKRRVKILNEFIKYTFGSKGVIISDEELYHYTK